MNGYSLLNGYGKLHRNPWNLRRFGTAKMAVLAVGLVVLPGAAGAGTDCRVVEYPERYEVVCVGDSAPVPVPSQTVISEAPRAKRQHRPQKSAMDAARLLRKRLLQKESAGSANALSTSITNEHEWR